MTALGDAVIAYHPEHHSFDGPGLKGRHSAGAGFLRGFIEHAEVDRLHFLVAGPAERESLKARLLALGRPHRPVEAISPDRADRLGAVGTLQLADVTLSSAAWSRRAHGERAYSLCGLTHSISSVTALEEFGRYLTAPVQPWDALICTSRAVQREVGAVLQHYAEYLASRLGAAPREHLRLPVIPLGVRTADYAQDEGLRAAFRARLDADPDDVVVLFLGRLSATSKANPTPLVMAADRAARRTARRLRVVFVGQFPNTVQEGVYTGVAAFAPGLPVHFLSGAESEIVDQAWRGADVFASLSDNVQESFGLTVVEAMAAGLPVVASDWDGYRDTVRDGATGFLIPTVLAPAGSGEDLAALHGAGSMSYDQYVSGVSLATAVDIDAAADALVRLAEDPELRARMGAAGRAAARDHYDWRHVVRSHQELWAELAEMRGSGQGLGPMNAHEPAHPLHRDPFSLFSAHPSRFIAADDLVVIDDPSHLERLLESRLSSVGAGALLLPPKGIRALVGRLGETPARVAALTEHLTVEDHRRALRTLAWLMKFGVVRVERS